MKNRINSFCVAIAVFTVIQCYSVFGSSIDSAEHKNIPLQILAIPGQNGLGSNFHEVQRLMGHDSKIQEISTPTVAIDFGQRWCMRYVRNACTQPCIIDATSQGTATALNFLAEDQGKQVKALVLKAVMASGNSAIYHTVSQGAPEITRIPFAYYWLPYAAKLMFPFYWPSGLQPIDAIEKVPTDTPIVIGHATNDFQLSYHDACALYYRLRARGNNNAYLITKHARQHVGVLDDAENIVNVQRILKKHKLLESDVAIGDLSPFQPEHTQFKPLYDALVRKEQVHKNVGKTLLGGVIIAAASAFYYYRTYLMSFFPAMAIPVENT